jgi:hypothetical protein
MSTIATSGRSSATSRSSCWTQHGCRPPRNGCWRRWSGGAPHGRRGMCGPRLNVRSEPPNLSTPPSERLVDCWSLRCWTSRSSWPRPTMGRLFEPFQRLDRPRRRPPRPRTVHRPRHRHHPRRHAHREHAAAGWPPDRDPLPAHSVRNATVGGIRDARTAGIRPANAPIRMAEAMPPDHASAGITTAQRFELAYTAVAAAPASTPTTPPMTARRIDSLRN